MTQGAIQLLSDSPIEARDTSRDGLDFHIYADVLSRAALGTPGPFTIGVFGEWGTGKTSLMQMVKGCIDADPETVTVWFNAWRYEQEQHPIVPLIATIIRGLECKRTALEKLEDKGRALITALRAVAYGFSSKAKVSIPGFAEVEAAFVAKDMIEREEKLTPDPLLDRSIYYEAFERLSRIEVGKRIKIVVLVDDLDRCFPDMAIKLLESIKLVLAQPSFIFILGVSRTVLEGYLQHRYQIQYGLADFDGRSYLDKIVQLPFPIPPHRDRMLAFSRRLLSTLQPSDAKELEEILPMIGAACGSNPRATVRFVNNLLIDKAINRSLATAGTMEEIPIGYFAVTRSLQQRSWRLFSLLVVSDELCGTLAGKDHPQLVELSTSDSALSEICTALLGDVDLEALLYSEHGRAWLTNADLRNAAIHFLRSTRRETRKSLTAGETSITAFVYHHSQNVSEAAAITNELLRVGVKATAMVHSAAPQEWVESLFKTSQELALVWLLGENWQVWEDRKVVERLVKLRGTRPYIFFVAVGEATASTLPEHIDHEFKLQLEKSYRAGDLLPLTTAIRARMMRAEWDNPETDSTDWR